MFVFIWHRGPCQGGYIVSIQADNTSALSWLCYASHSHQPIMRELSHFALGLTLASPIPPKLVGSHIKGDLNLGADALSWPKEYTTWACATKQHSPLGTCQAYQVLHELLPVLAMIVTLAKTGVAYKPPTTALLTLEPTTLVTGWLELGLNSSYSRGSHQSKWLC